MTIHTTTHFDSDGDNSAQAARTVPGWIAHLHVVNQNTADAYIQLFDLATGDVTVGATTPKQSYLVPGGDGTNDGALDVDFNPMLSFDTAITYACTTTATGSGDPTTGLTVNLVMY